MNTNKVLILGLEKQRINLLSSLLKEMEAEVFAVENIQDAENLLGETINKTLSRGGSVLIPVLAVGRAQEIMIIIEDLMRKNVIPKVPVYLDGMIWEATAIHTTYPEYLKPELKDRIFHKGENPFLSEIFALPRQIRNLFNGACNSGNSGEDFAPLRVL